MILFQLFLEFFKIGLFAIGGGLSSLPFLYDIANKTNWLTQTDVTNLIAISETTPGPIGVNAATYVGFLASGVSGAIVSTLGLICPSIIIIIVISYTFQKFQNNKIFQNIFYGLRPASCALISSACVLVIKNTFFMFSTNGVHFIFTNVILGIILFLFISRTKLHPVIYILISAIFGIIFKL